MPRPHPSQALQSLIAQLRPWQLSGLCPQIIHTDSNTVLGQNDTGFSCDGSASTFRVMFKEPVEVLPNVNYTACATLKVGSALHPRACSRSLQVLPLSWEQPDLTMPPTPASGPGLSLWHQRSSQGDPRVPHHGG